MPKRSLKFPFVMIYTVKLYVLRLLGPVIFQLLLAEYPFNYQAMALNIEKSYKIVNILTFF